jgi:hypothetical protein
MKMMHKIWDFEQKCFVNSHNLIFKETQFLKPSDFDEPLADAYDRRTPTLEPQLFKEIVVQQPLAL